MSAHFDHRFGQFKPSERANLSNHVFISYGFILDCLVVWIVGIGQCATKFNSSFSGFGGRISLLSCDIFLRSNVLYPDSSVVVCKLSVDLG